MKIETFGKAWAGKTCPHCGERNSTIKGGDFVRVFVPKRNADRVVHCNCPQTTRDTFTSACAAHSEGIRVRVIIRYPRKAIDRRKLFAETLERFSSGKVAISRHNAVSIEWTEFRSAKVLTGNRDNHLYSVKVEVDGHRFDSTDQFLEWYSGIAQSYKGRKS